ncbi:hypothetical protein A2U01_0038857, partial [Trifolium medium]|nr:hypothetical protein [Trifolium medium]
TVTRRPKENAGLHNGGGGHTNAGVASVMLLGRW